MNAKELVIEFVDRINSGDIDGLCKLMSEQHRFIDALGMTVEGRDRMRQAWVGYFRMVPDYNIRLDEIIEQGEVVAAFGVAGGTYSTDGQLLDENRWDVPAAWRAQVEDGLILEWRVYTDNEPIRKLMARGKP